MSKLIPRQTIDAIRHQVNVVLDIYGIECELYIPNNIDEVNSYDVYRKPEDYTYDKYTTTVFIDWSPNMYRLKHYGLYVEDELPIVVSLGTKGLNEDNETVSFDAIRNSYIKISPEYVTGNHKGYEEFELVDMMVKNMHDAVLVKQWKAVPRRFKDRV